MAHAHIQRLKKQLTEARAKGMTDEEVIAILADAARQSPEAMENIIAAYCDSVTKNRSDVSAALEGLLFQTPQVIEPTPLAKAVADSFGKTRKGVPSKVRQNIEHGSVPRVAS